MPRKKELLIEALHLIQDKYHYLSAKHLVALAHELKLSSAEVYEVATFYHHFDVIKESDINLKEKTLPPPITVRVCNSVTCEMSGSKELLDELNKESMVIPDSGEVVRIQSVPCVGRCQHAPVAVVGKNPVDYASTGRIKQKVEEKAVIPEIPKYTGLEEYMASGGYQLFQNCITEKKTPEEVINEIKEEVENKEYKAETTASHNHEKVENIEKQEEIKKEIKSEEKIPEPKLEPKIEKPKTNTVEIQTEIPGINENKVKEGSNLEKKDDEKEDLEIPSFLRKAIK